MSDADVPTLVRRSQRGDRKAFEEIVRVTARAVYAQIAGVVRDRQKAEDIAQETFVAAWKGIGTVESVETAGGFIAWLLTLARNATLDAVKFENRKKRGGGKSGAGSDAEEVADAGPSPVESAARVEACGRALAILEELPEEYRRVLSMRYLAGADYETIRRGLEISDGALRGLLSRGMAMMRERMGKGERNAECGMRNEE